MKYKGIRSILWRQSLFKAWKDRRRRVFLTSWTDPFRRPPYVTDYNRVRRHRFESHAPAYLRPLIR